MITAVTISSSHETNARSGFRDALRDVDVMSPSRRCNERFDTVTAHVPVARHVTGAPQQAQHG